MPANYNQKFKDAFEGFENYYVIIGGTAASFILDSRGLESRTTKDYDMVIVKKDRLFFRTLETFLKEGSYRPHLTDNEQLYRFTTDETDYPKMIELFSKEPFPLSGHGRITPLPFDDGMSMSALLLDTNYYDLLMEGSELVNGYSVLTDKNLIIFKAKAWLDLKGRKEKGEQVDSKNIKKHLNDIARLIGALSDTEKPKIPVSIQKDLNKFLAGLSLDSIPPQVTLTKQEIFDRLHELLSETPSNN